MSEQPPGSGHTLGVLLVVVSAVTFSTAGLFAKGVSAAPWDIIFWRGVFSAGFTIAWTWQRGQMRQNFVQMGAPGLVVAVIGGLGTAAFIAAFKLTTIANVSLIYAVAPLLAALLAWVWIGERATRRVILGAGLALFWGRHHRVRLARSDQPARRRIGHVHGRADGDLPQIPRHAGRRPCRLVVGSVAACRAFYGAPFGLPLAEIALLSLFGLVFAVASVTLAEGAKRLPSGQAALLSTLEVPLAPVLAFAVLSEMPGPRTLIGGALVLCAVLLTVRQKT